MIAMTFTRRCDTITSQTEWFDSFGKIDKKTALRFFHCFAFEESEAKFLFIFILMKKEITAGLLTSMAVISFK